MAVQQFKDEYRFLSNMYEFEQPIFGPDGFDIYVTEVGYQASKFADPLIRAAVMATDNGKGSKSLANHIEQTGVPVVPEWHEVKVPVMQNLVNMKFRNNPDLASKLLDTGTAPIIEGNYWGDRFWGVSPVGSNNGENHLGIILMDLRDRLRMEKRSFGMIVPLAAHRIGSRAVNSMFYPHLENSKAA